MLFAVSNVSCASACPNSFTPDGSPVNVFVRISESSLLLSFVRATKYFVSLPVNAIIILPPDIVRPRRCYLFVLHCFLPVHPERCHVPLHHRLLIRVGNLPNPFLDCRASVHTHPYPQQTLQMLARLIAQSGCPTFRIVPFLSVRQKFL